MKLVIKLMYYKQSNCKKDQKLFVLQPQNIGIAI